MAKRYGRNQRRHHRERIAELERQVMMGCRAPRPSTPRLEDLAPIKSYEIRLSEGQRRFEHEAELEVVFLGDGFHQLHNNLGYQGEVSWQGRAYYLDQIELPAPAMDFVVGSVRLKGIGGR